MITTSPALRACYLDTVSTIEEPLAAAIVERCPAVDQLTAQVLAAGVGAAAKLALRQWLHSASAATSMKGFVVPSGSLPTLIRTALTPLAPALDGAATRLHPEGPTRPRTVAILRHSYKINHTVSAVNTAACWSAAPVAPQPR
ncbi:hypothetical protein ACFQ1L_34570 [Phytohabitans flavus]|uniref:hypothetical protein n=1 Tax=Phytohabitans flavus TaxID=1076124 RepID=UPI00363856F6